MVLPIRFHLHKQHFSSYTYSLLRGTLKYHLFSTYCNSATFPPDKANLKLKSLIIETRSISSTPHIHQNIDSISADKKVYTRTGDDGTTSLYTGERRRKDDQVFTVLGNLDELSSFIGMAKETAVKKNHECVDQLERIQCILQDVGTLVASPINLKEIKDDNRRGRTAEKIRFSERHIKELELWIDQHTESLPSLSNFILPGGGLVSASLHVCRAICRRTERSLVPLSGGSECNNIDANVLVYLNRLSDYFFTVARRATVLDGKKETIYIRPKPGGSANK